MYVVRNRTQNERHRFLYTTQRGKRYSQGLVCLESVVVDDVLPSLSHRLHLPKRARLAPLQVLRVHRDDVAPLVLLSRHQQLHCRLQAKRPRTCILDIFNTRSNDKNVVLVLRLLQHCARPLTITPSRKPPQTRALAFITALCMQSHLHNRVNRGWSMPVHNVASTCKGHARETSTGCLSYHRLMSGKSVHVALHTTISNRGISFRSD